ncbi:MAG: glycosyltransferase family 4 protein [Chthoniobacteraceae bacterium]
MKVLVLCYEYPPIGGGGGNVAKAVAEQLVARGHEVRVQTAALGWRSTRETIAGVDVFRTASLRKVPDTCTVPEMGLYVLTSFRATMRHIRQWKPDVIHAHFAVPTGLLAWAVHCLTDVPYVLTAHLGDVPGGVPAQTDKIFRLIGPLARRIWRDAAATTAVSSFVQELAETAYGRPVTRILNGIELGDSPLEPVEPHSPRRLVFIGRLNPQKNPVFFIDALARIRDATWTLTLIGDGPLMGEVRAAIARHGLGNRIALTGWLPPPQVHAFLNHGDILCMPSLSEGMPIVGIEALKFGLAVVASDIPGLRDVIDDGVNGCLVPLGDLEAFAARLQRLMENETTLAAMKRASWEKARRFDLSCVAHEYAHILKQAAESPTTGQPSLATD